MNSKQQGFTLIELIMVIVILGVLAAFAVPKFANLGSEARVAAIRGAAGAVKSSASIAHSAYLARGLTGSTVSLEGTTINMVNGYPQARAVGLGGILEASQITASDFAFDASGAGNIATSVVIVQAVGAATAANCSVSYTAAAASAAPTITVTTSGC